VEHIAGIGDLFHGEESQSRSSSVVRDCPRSPLERSWSRSTQAEVNRISILDFSYRYRLTIPDRVNGAAMKTCHRQARCPARNWRLRNGGACHDCIFHSSDL
jgi:hypothetical protein